MPITLYLYTYASVYAYIIFTPKVCFKALLNIALQLHHLSNPNGQNLELLKESEAPLTIMYIVKKYGLQPKSLNVRIQKHPLHQVHVITMAPLPGKETRRTGEKVHKSNCFTFTIINV